MSRLMAIFAAAALIVGTLAYMLVVVPTLNGLESAFIDAGAGQAEQGHFDNIKLVLLQIAPALFVLGALAYLYVAVVKRQGYRGRY